MKDRSSELAVASVRKKWQRGQLLYATRRQSMDGGTREVASGHLPPWVAHCIIYFLYYSKYYFSWYKGAWLYAHIMGGLSPASIFQAYLFPLSSIVHGIVRYNALLKGSIHLLCMSESFKTGGI